MASKEQRLHGEVCVVRPTVYSASVTSNILLDKLQLMRNLYKQCLTVTVELKRHSRPRHKERFMKFKFPYAAISILAVVCALPAALPQSAHAQMQLRGVSADSAVTRYRTTKIDGIEIF